MQTELVLVVQDIPETLAKLQKLKILNLDNNGLHAVPSQVLVRCQSLHTLLLHDNPISAQVSSHD